MQVNIESSWKEILAPEFEKPYFASLVTFVRNAYTQERVYPAAKNIFHAFSLCPFSDVRVVILGQDPYHGVGQAHGLCFSVPEGIRTPPSLVNIFKEIKADIGTPIPPNGNLERWARQGVLLLNATLTVAAHRAGSHQNQGWETFTDAVISTISREKSHIVFLLWGAYAGHKTELIDGRKHCILRSPHPSPFSAHRGFLGNKHFSQTNAYLSTYAQTPIVW